MSDAQVHKVFTIAISVVSFVLIAALLLWRADQQDKAMLWCMEDPACAEEVRNLRMYTEMP